MPPFAWSFSADSILNLFPAAPNEGIKEYINIIGVTPDADSNIGIADYNRNYLSQNPCFRDLAAEFYASIWADDLQRAASESSAASFKELATIKPHVTLDKTSEDVGQKPGWLWQRALKYSHGDKLLAVQLIGVCGHDDANQGVSFSMRREFGPGQIVRDSKQPLGVSLDSQDRIEQMISLPILKEAVNQSWKNLPDTQKKGLSAENVQGKYDWYANDVPVKLKTAAWGCPKYTSEMYYPGGLGKDVDISTELKEKIAAIQAPTKGASVLPAKTYHTTGEAFASCHLVSRGVPNLISKQLVWGAVNGYRAGRLCEKLTTVQPIPNTKTPDEAISDFYKIRQNPDKCYKVIQKEHDSQTVLLPGAPTYCYLALTMDNFFFTDPDITPEIIKNKVTRALAENDVAAMFQKNGYYRLSNFCKGPQLTAVVARYMELYGGHGHSNPCPRDLNTARCGEARKVMDTYSIDFKWTEAEHMAGLKFAEANCPVYDPIHNPEAVSCQILGRPQKTNGQGLKKSDSGQQ